MANRFPTDTLIRRLPEVRGGYSENAALNKITWFRVGGPAEVMFRPADADDLIRFLNQRPADVPVIVLGVGSNLLIRDGGVPGVVIRLGREFARIEAEETEIIAGAGALDLNVAATARDAGLTGLEFLSGIPGTIGGALRMNAGAFGSEIKDVFIAARALDGGGQVRELSPDDMAFAYRSSNVPEDWTFLEMRLKCRRGERSDISRRMGEIQSTRQTTQPMRAATGGSTFTNPPGGHAWELIDQAGCRGLKMGGAMVSEKHCNFLINTGEATADDLESLGEEVRHRVKETCGVDLHWEIRRIGIPAEGQSLIEGQGPAQAEGTAS